ncbi:MAG TPA: hypothetical protein VFR13_03825 [Jiangellaceae bacterium]|nr:hypothetical protein [Jiangellaceae bacterium]
MLVRQLAVGALTALGLVGCAAGAGSQAESPGSRGSAALSASPAAPACGEPCYADPEVTGSLSSELVVEVSGVAASHSAAGVYYVVGDEPGTDEVVAVRDDGTLVARIGVAGMSAENAEALAVGACGPHDSNPCVFVADIGDHVGRPYVVVYRFQEPDLTAPPPNVVAADALRYSYPDAATDAEALIVDDSGRPLIVSKAAFDQASATTGPTRLYRGDPAGGVLELLGEIDLPTPDRPVLTGIAGNVVTDASSTDGRVLLRTYDQVIEYRAAQAGAELGGFRTWPYRLVPAPAQIQSEAIAYQHDCGYLTISEFTGSIATVGCRS